MLAKVAAAAGAAGTNVAQPRASARTQKRCCEGWSWICSPLQAFGRGNDREAELLIRPVRRAMEASGSVKRIGGAPGDLTKFGKRVRGLGAVAAAGVLAVVRSAAAPRGSRQDRQGARASNGLGRGSSPPPARSSR